MKLFALMHTKSLFINLDKIIQVYQFMEIWRDLKCDIITMYLITPLSTYATRLRMIHDDDYMTIDRFHSRDRWPQWGGETIRNI